MFAQFIFNDVYFLFVQKIEKQISVILIIQLWFYKMIENPAIASNKRKNIRLSKFFDLFSKI